MSILYLVPFFDENVNSFSKLLVPILEELERQHIPFTIYSSNANYRGRFAAHHQAKFVKARLEFLVFPLNLLLGTFLAWRWQRKNPGGIVHNVGGGSSFYQDLITAHACHAQYLKTKRLYGEWHRILLNPIHGMIILTEWLNYRRRPPVIAVSEFTSEGLTQNHPRLAGSITIIENATNVGPQSIQRSPSARFRILFASNNHHHKGLQALLEAMDRAKSAKLDWLLQIAGEDPFAGPWKQQVRDRNLQDSVSFLGHRSDIAALMADSDIFCLPSKYESFGMAFLEAAQMGCPSYGTKTGILETLYKPRQGPALCDHPVQGNVLFEGLRYWAEHPTERQELGRTMQQSVAKFRPDEMVRHTIEIYERLFARKRAASSLNSCQLPSTKNNP